MQSDSKRKQLKIADLDVYFWEFMKWYSLLRNLYSVGRILYKIYVKLSFFSLGHSDEVVSKIWLDIEFYEYDNVFVSAAVYIPLNSIQDILATDYIPELIPDHCRLKDYGLKDARQVIVIHKS